MAAGGEADGPLFGEVKEAMRAYVMGPETMARAETTVVCAVTHSNLQLRIIELRFDLHMTVGEAKGVLYSYCGSKVPYMRLELYEGSALRCVLADDSKKLGFYGVSDGMRIHIVDTDPFSLSKDGGLDDVSQIEKYRMSEEEYDKREGTLRAWKREQQRLNPHFTYAGFLKQKKAETEVARLRRLGEEIPQDLQWEAEGKDPETERARLRGEVRAAERKASAAAAAAAAAAAGGGGAGPAAGAEGEGGAVEEAKDEDAEPEEMVGKEVGMRCSVYPGDRRGAVAWKGKIGGHWLLGVKLDEPLPGKAGDGARNGVRYFEAEAGYGAFVKPDRVTVGDFPSLEDQLLNDDEL